MDHSPIFFSKRQSFWLWRCSYEVSTYKPQYERKLLFVNERFPTYFCSPRKCIVVILGPSMLRDIKPVCRVAIPTVLSLERMQTGRDYDHMYDT